MPPLTVLHADERLLVCAKPPNLLTVPSPGGRGKGEETLAGRLLREGHGRLLPVHRLDRETSGVVVLARDKEAREAVMDVFKRRDVLKGYVAWVQGHPEPRDGILRFPIKDLGARAVVSADGQPAETRYSVKACLGPCARVEIDLRTGRHNQIRLHFSHIGHPLVGERKYARGKDATVRHKRAALHASWLEFTHPFGNERLHIQAPIPQDLRNLQERLRGGP
jgi:RluA family pseudouridine synthase